MAHHTDTIFCQGCGVEILWEALIAHKGYYCCQDCLDGRPCACAEWLEPGANSGGRAAAAMQAMSEGLAIVATAAGNK